MLISPLVEPPEAVLDPQDVILGDPVITEGVDEVLNYIVEPGAEAPAGHDRSDDPLWVVIDRLPWPCPDAPLWQKEAGFLRGLDPIGAKGPGRGFSLVLHRVQPDLDPPGQDMTGELKGQEN